MQLVSEKRELPAGEWRSEDLERVEACPVCGGAKRTRLYSGLQDRVFFCAPGKWTLYRCEQCESAYLDPRPTPQSIGEAYRLYFTHNENSELDKPLSPKRDIFWLKRVLRNGYLNSRYGYHLQPSSVFGSLAMTCFARQKVAADRLIRDMKLPSNGGKLLDLGCGNGKYLRLMRSFGWEVYGIDPDVEAIATAKENGLDVKAGLLQADTYSAESFDAITLNHVIEHLHDPEATLRLCMTILRPGGVLWIATPNLEANGHALFKQSWLGLDPPRHLVLFNPASLASLMQRVGLKVSPQINRWDSATFLYQTSAAVAQEMDPFGSPPPLSAEMQQKLSEAEVRARQNIATCEEIVYLGYKSA